MYLKIKSFTLSSILLLPLLSFADVPHFDIVEVMYKGKKYYVPGLFKEGGILKNHDLCYYDYNGEYIGEVQDYILQYGIHDDSISLYSSMEKINLKKLKFDEGIEGFDDILKIFNGGIKSSIKEFKKKFILMDAYHGNTVGFTHTAELKETDNIWINEYPIETLFSLGHDICSYNFFAIKGNLNKKDKIKLEAEMNYLLKSYDSSKKFWEKISELYSKNIIMVGYCSC